ncbi:MAG: copper-binding protein [Brevundimonas sp.]|uniref:copper-binding protein n=1 Tax=Brevundimonas sp. TaxID=1871086 RepID=UPI00263504E8|nr:copper-binding protein [Brevundimonas sp.]MDI6623533.1 copper-binding protein [Brevundimonas sp.]MDQ7812618.1 copper-binding protein [Brevundimonas sp.]
MKYALILGAGMALGLAACNQPQETPAATGKPAAEASDTAAMPMTADAGVQIGTGTGVITAVDPDAGTVTVEHGPIPGVGWPAMTMRFTASPAVLEAASTGERIEFDVSVRDGVNEITAIRPE